MGRETSVQRTICDQLDRLDRCWWTKIHQTGRGRRGIPDLLVCYRGVFLAIECKQPRGQLRTEQANELHHLQRAGAIAIIARRWDDVLPWIQRIDRDTRTLNLGYTTGERVSRNAPRIQPTIVELDDNQATA